MISAVASFCLVLKEVKLLILRSTKHTSVLIVYRVMSVSDIKARSRAILVFFGLEPAPPSFRHARPPKRCWYARSTSFGLWYSSASGTVSRSVVLDLFRKRVLQKKGRNVPPGSMWNKCFMLS